MQCSKLHLFDHLVGAQQEGIHSIASTAVICMGCFGLTR
jgi:hypothetical protein